ncbi:pyrimidine 5'-nucleotidase [Salinivibrio sp. YCSC6]|uniref:pyrimidine 5'-nucleotidase n=1 Tax=Salinivibrio sp. YCSC6 TaxID=2003370 RepID=UPI000BBC498B|nr:pyrimidine 5'-nucleotidase [Salinivibrio sp. YCSC6]PCE66809.1 noncanonical pyrimidine nucleotidase, YjjG family [Salinivibrio sp. YCSC6]QCF36292.1 pyrimidine 5'-nucleotidase [Salinivibrio sp. YCSC6]
MRYPWVLFDADETLFHFDAFAGLQRMFSHYDVDFDQHAFAEYSELNKPLWVQYQNGEIDAHTLQTKRFTHWGKQLRVAPTTLNQHFLDAMAEICEPLPGAEALLNAIRPHAHIGIITNGFTALQDVRLEKTGFKPAISTLVVSEQVGFAKPDPRIFEHAFAKMGHPPKSQILMVGDNPMADVLGGMRAGIDTCWLNRDKKPLPEGVTPTHQVDSLHALQAWLMPDNA